MLASMKGQPLTMYEREKIEFFRRCGWSIRKIAKELCRDHSVISREFKNNTGRDGVYKAHKAHEYAQRRLKKIRKRKIETDERLREYIVSKIKDEQWSPEQIVGRLKKHPDPEMKGKGVSHETIYQFIYKGEGRFLGLYQHLRTKRKRRQPRYSRKYRKNKENKQMQYITPICLREEKINNKTEFGHWESDTTICENKGQALSVQYERTIQLSNITRVQNKGAKETDEAIRYLVETSPKEWVKSITFDRGSEGALHYNLRLDYDIDTFHCDPYKSYQKGGVEQMNKLIRQYIPRGTDLSQLTDKEIYEIQERINNRPRKQLHFRTPNECAKDISKSLEVVHW